MQALDLSNNALVSLPSFDKLKALRTVGFARNQIKSVPPNLAKINTLQEIDISFNQLTDLPNELRASKAFIQCHGNPFGSIPEQIVESGGPTLKKFLHTRST